MKKNNKGVITLEACISVLAFLILMLLLSGLFIMFMAQNVTAHVALQTSQSLSIEAYSIDNLTVESNSIGSVGDYLGQFIKSLFGTAEESPAFVADGRWYEGDKTVIAQAVKKRFIGYLSGGDEKEADEFLKNINIVGGINGLDFSDSYVQDDTLYIVLKYTLEYDFNIWKVGNVSVKQTTCSKLWK